MFLKWLTKIKEKRIKNYTKRNKDKPNAFVIIRGNKVYSPIHTFRKARKELPCSYCGRTPVNEHDACISNLPGVIAACCGHGDKGKAYIAFKEGMVVHWINGKKLIIERN